ncbi:MAG: hypothetical protein WBR26_17755 [Candidatus Acidiferrum sp.]
MATEGTKKAPESEKSGKHPTRDQHTKNQGGRKEGGEEHEKSNK